MPRNLSPQVMFQNWAENVVPRFRFDPERYSSLAAWKEEALPAILATLGEPPPPAVDPAAELIAEWEQDGLLRQKWILEVQQHLSATLLVNRPLGLPGDERLPAIFCTHGHGPYGKEPVMGNDSTPEMRAHTKQHGYDYGRRMALAGFVTYSLDWIGFGERNDENKPNHHANPGGRDWCNLYLLHATLLGSTVLAIHVAHGQAATTFVQSLPGVDPNRLGIMGLSGGGTTALWLSLADPRFQATEIICYSDRFAVYGIRDLNYCGMQVTPGLLRLADLPDLQSLLVPRPLLISIGAQDTCFTVDSALACHRQVSRMYEYANAADRLELDLHAGEHAWAGNKSFAFFKKHLGAIG